MNYHQGQELWNSGNKYNHPVLLDKISWTWILCQKDPAGAINFELKIQIIQITEWQFKKSILQTESRVSEQISEQKRTSKQDPLKWGIPKKCIIPYFRVDKFRNKFFVFCWGLKHYHHNSPSITMCPLGAPKNALQTSETVDWPSLTRHSCGNL